RGGARPGSNRRGPRRGRGPTTAGPARDRRRAPALRARGLRAEPELDGAAPLRHVRPNEPAARQTVRWAPDERLLGRHARAGDRSERVPRLSGDACAGAALTRPGVGTALVEVRPPPGRPRRGDARRASDPPGDTPCCPWR